jgi:hypothetical protein
MMDLVSPNCPCCDSPQVHAHTRYPTQTKGTRTIHHCRRCDSYCSDTYATAMAGLRTPLSRIIEVLKARTEVHFTTKVSLAVKLGILEIGISWLQLFTIRYAL